MKNDPLPSDLLLSQLKLIFLALLIGQILLLLIIGLLILPDYWSDFWVTDLRTWIILVLVVILAFAANIISRNRLRKLRSEKDDAMLYAGYRSTCILKWALLELCAFLGAISAYQYQQPLLLFVGVCGFIVFALNYPSEKRMFEELRLGFKY